MSQETKINIYWFELQSPSDLNSEEEKRGRVTFVVVFFSPFWSCLIPECLEKETFFFLMLIMWILLGVHQYRCFG